MQNNHSDHPLHHHCHHHHYNHHHCHYHYHCLIIIAIIIIMVLIIIIIAIIIIIILIIIIFIIIIIIIIIIIAIIIIIIMFIIIIIIIIFKISLSTILSYIWKWFPEKTSVVTLTDNTFHAVGLTVFGIPAQQCFLNVSANRNGKKTLYFTESVNQHTRSLATIGRWEKALLHIEESALS